MLLLDYVESSKAASMAATDQEFNQMDNELEHETLTSTEIR